MVCFISQRILSKTQLENTEVSLAPMDVANLRLSFFRSFGWLIFGLTLLVGCSLHRNSPQWQPLSYTAPDADAIGNFRLVGAEDTYFHAATLESKNCPECVDEYLKAAGKSWTALEQEFSKTGKSSPRTLSLYHSSVAKVLVTGQRFGRWHPQVGLSVSSLADTTVLPASYHGFSWDPFQFQHLEPVGDYSSPALTTTYRCGGLGVPLVVSRNVANPQPFTPQQQSFAATAIIRSSGEPKCYQLEFYDPLRESHVHVGCGTVALSRDLSAPIAYESLDEDRQWLRSFLQPGATGASDGLFMVEPYQPGKIPVVFIHGLLSDPTTWADLVNELQSHPELSASYQWWGFQYATGEPFLSSAAVLRKQLRQVRATYDPQCQDPAFSQIVLIGHSMGGIVAKLQVTNSGNQLWQSASRQPLATLVTDQKTHRDLQEAFYFQPSPNVRRVIFIGTPHTGSAWARRPVGRLGAVLVEPAAETESRHAQLIRDNPHSFREEFRERIPTSIDLLEPESALLAATNRLHYSQYVTLHSIIGTGKNMRDGKPGDGVVPVASARLPGVASETFLDATHEALHRNPGTVKEVARILNLHRRASGSF